MKLFELTTPTEKWYVVAEHFTEAEEKLMKLLKESDYGFIQHRKVIKIELLATMYNDIRFIAGHNLLI